MSDVLDEVLHVLSRYKEFYDIARVVDPIKKRTCCSSDDYYNEESCFCFFDKMDECVNCISKRTATEKDTYSKIEYRNRDLYFVISFEETVGEKTYIVELIKVISKENYLHKKIIEKGNEIENLINKLNNKVVEINIDKTFTKHKS